MRRKCQMLVKRVLCGVLNFKAFHPLSDINKLNKHTRTAVSAPVEFSNFFDLVLYFIVSGVKSNAWFPS